MRILSTALCLVAIASPAAVAAEPRQKPTAQELWEAFPLAPQAEKQGGSPAPAPVRPRVAEASGENSSASPSRFVLVALVAAVGAMTLLALWSLVPVRLPRRVRQPRRHLAPVLQGTAAFGVSFGARARHALAIDVPSLGGARARRPLAQLRGPAGAVASFLVEDARMLVDLLRRAAVRGPALVWSSAVLTALFAVALGVSVGYLFARYLE